MDHKAIETVILQSIRQTNLARDPDQQLDASPDAPIFGPASSLDSLGLVALLMDIEEALQDQGCAVTLSDARAMSQTHSPFRDVPALVAYVAMVLDDRA